MVACAGKGAEAPPPPFPPGLTSYFQKPTERTRKLVPNNHQPLVCPNIPRRSSREPRAEFAGTFIAIHAHLLPPSPRRPRRQVQLLHGPVTLNRAVRASGCSGLTSRARATSRQRRFSRRPTDSTEDFTRATFAPGHARQSELMLLSGASCNFLLLPWDAKGGA